MLVVCLEPDKQDTVGFSGLICWKKLQPAPAAAAGAEVDESWETSPYILLDCERKEWAGV